MLNDADIETAEWHAAGDMVANGICLLCEDALDVWNKRFDNDRRWSGGNTLQNRANRAKWAKLLGPVAPWGGGTYHKYCLDADN